MDYLEHSRSLDKHGQVSIVLEISLCWRLATGYISGGGSEAQTTSLHQFFAGTLFDRYFEFEFDSKNHERADAIITYGMYSKYNIFVACLYNHNPLQVVIVQ